MAVSGYVIGAEIAKALGLPPDTTDIQINIGVDEAVNVICRFYPSEAGMRAVTQTLERYHLHPAEDDPVSAEDAQAREDDREVHERPARRKRLRERLLFRPEPDPEDEERV